MGPLTESRSRKGVKPPTDEIRGACTLGLGRGMRAPRLSSVRLLQGLGGLALAGAVVIQEDALRIGAVAGGADVGRDVGSQHGAGAAAQLQGHLRRLGGGYGFDGF